MVNSASRLLLIDDDEANRLTLSALLEDEGFLGEGASTVEQGQQCLFDEPTYDVVLLDWNLDGTSGSALLAPIRNHHPGARIIVVTGDKARLSRVSDVDGVFQKNDRFEALLALLPNARR